MVTNLVQNFQGGGRVRRGRMKSRITPPTIQMADTKPTTQVINPPSSNNTVVQNYAVQKEQKKQQYSGGGGTKVPQINAEKYISKQKIRTLGIMG